MRVLPVCSALCLRIGTELKINLLCLKSAFKREETEYKYQVRYKVIGAPIAFWQSRWKGEGQLSLPKTIGNVEPEIK